MAAGFQAGDRVYITGSTGLRVSGPHTILDLLAHAGDTWAVLDAGSQRPTTDLQHA